MSVPKYACAIIHARRQRFLMERRPRDGRVAGGFYTCFGGSLRPTESPERGMLRELREELAWTPKRWQPAVDLWVGEVWIARFYEVPCDRLLPLIRPGVGDLAEVLTAQQLGHGQVSRWHRMVLQAWHMGRLRVQLDR